MYRFDPTINISILLADSCPELTPRDKTHAKNPIFIEENAPSKTTLKKHPRNSRENHY
jgi:hypothetical protein